MFRKSNKCLIQRRAYNIELKNSKLSVTLQQQIVRFVDFNVVCANLSTHGNQLTFKFEGSEKELFLEVTGDEQKWSQQISKIINETEGKPKKRSYICRKSPLDFFKTKHALNEEFEKNANTGDIILFRSQHSAATIQRVFTDSEYGTSKLI